MTTHNAQGHREVCFDTETTGTNPGGGDRVVEIACVELIDLMPTGREFHTYCDPERDMPAEAFRVHGLSREFLRGKPRFSQVADEFLAFVGDSTLVAHNATFDIRFINMELERCRRKPMGNRYVDTVAQAKRKFPGAKTSLDALCSRFGIDLSGREKHGALIDTRLLARVYLELNGGRERVLELRSPEQAAAALAVDLPIRAARALGGASEAEIARHTAFLKDLKAPIWAALAAGAAAAP